MSVQKHPFRSTAALFILLMALWLLASGHYTTLLIGLGVGSSAFIVFLSRRMGIADDEGVPVHMSLRALRYIPWLVVAVFRANVDVARRILQREPNLSPQIIEAETSQKTDLGRVLYANSITLTPGTVSIRVHGDRITVHAIAKEVAEELLGGEMDQQVTRMEGKS